MDYYISGADFQKELNNYYNDFQEKSTFIELANNLYIKELLLTKQPNLKKYKVGTQLTDEEFENILEDYPLILPDTIFTGKKTAINEDIFPREKDCFIIQHFHNVKSFLHIHDFFEMNYLYKGKCKMNFEDDVVIMNEGEFCIIAPNSKHQIEYIDDKSKVISILVRKSTFEKTFFGLISQKNLLAHFFKNILYDKGRSNYLVFYTIKESYIRDLIKNIMLENCNLDEYSNSVCIGWLHILFSLLLRNYSDTIDLYFKNSISIFSMMLQYVQSNYTTVTLREVSNFFSYSETYTSILFKKNLGYTFSDLIKQMRMNDAKNYLINSDLKISKIALKCGYKSTDHFSRMFRSEYNISPQSFRKKAKHKDI